MLTLVLVLALIPLVSDRKEPSVASAPPISPKPMARLINFIRDRIFVVDGNIRYVSNRLVMMRTPGTDSKQSWTVNSPSNVLNKTRYIPR